MNVSTSRPLAVITGASSGIGAVFAKKLAARGYDLLLMARRDDRLKELAASLPEVEVRTLAVDLTEADDLEAAAAQIKAEPHVDLLVNNAGFGTRGLFHEAPYAEQLRMHRLHIDAILRLTHAALPGMVGRNGGALINVSSVAAFTRTPRNVSYCATKAWISAFTEGIYLEMKISAPGVTVQALCPGFTYSEFHDVAGVDRGRIAKSLWMNADTVVEASLRGLAARRLFVVPGWRYRLLTMMVSRIPTALRLALETRSPHTREAGDGNAKTNPAARAALKTEVPGHKKHLD